MVAAASPLVAVLIPVAQVAHALERLLALYRGVAVQPAAEVVQALRLLLEVCSGKVVVAVVQHAVHMPQAPVV